MSVSVLVLVGRVIVGPRRMIILHRNPSWREENAQLGGRPVHISTAVVALRGEAIALPAVVVVVWARWSPGSGFLSAGAASSRASGDRQADYGNKQSIFALPTWRLQVAEQIARPSSCCCICISKSTLKLILKQLCLHRAVKC